MARLMSIAEIVADRELVTGVAARAIDDAVVDFSRAVESMPEGTYFMLEGGGVMRLTQRPYLRAAC